jgi:hypothetical protein
MLALDFLGVPFARTMHVRVQMAFVRKPRHNYRYTSAEIN